MRLACLTDAILHETKSGTNEKSKHNLSRNERWTKWKKSAWEQIRLTHFLFSYGSRRVDV